MKTLMLLTILIFIGCGMGDFYIVKQRQIENVDTNIIDDNFYVYPLKVVNYDGANDSTVRADVITIPKTNFPPQQYDTFILQDGDKKAYAMVASEANDEGSYYSFTAYILKKEGFYTHGSFESSVGDGTLKFFNLSELKRGLFRYNGSLYSLGDATVPYEATRAYQKDTIVIDYDTENMIFKSYKITSDITIFSTMQHKIPANNEEFRPATCDGGTNCYSSPRYFLTNKVIYGNQYILGASEFKDGSGDIIPLRALTYIRSSIKNIGEFDVPTNIYPIIDPTDEVQIWQRDLTYLVSKEGTMYSFDGHYNNIVWLNVQNDPFMFFIYGISAFPENDLRFEFIGENKLGMAMPLNQDKIYDEYSTSYAEVKAGDYTEMSTSCSFDFVALRRILVGGFTIDIKDSSGAVVETHTIEINTDEPKTFTEVIDCNDCDLSSCAWDEKTDWAYNLEKKYDNTHTIRFTFHTDGKIGAVFVGENMSIPCVSMSSLPRFVGYVSDEENSITQTLTTSPTEAGRRSTPVTIEYESPQSALEFFNYLLASAKYPKFLNISSETGYSLLSHFGFVRNMEVVEDGYKVKFTLTEYNNA